MASKKRDHLVNVAADLFYREGIHATGIDKIINQSGVARMTLYKHFKSKEELVLETLKQHERQIREWLVAAVERYAQGPSERLLAVFDAFDEMFRSDGFWGCFMHKATGEFPNMDGPIRRTAIQHKQMIRSYIHGLAVEAGVNDPVTIANQIFLLLEGAIVTAQVTGNVDAAKEARVAAEVLVDNVGKKTDQGELA